MSVEGGDERERFVQWLQSKMTSDVGGTFARKCVSLLDAVGGPQNFAAYFYVLSELRRSLGWGYRRGWLQSLSDWEFLRQIYRQCGWVLNEYRLPQDKDYETSPRFAKPGYPTLFGHASSYGRLSAFVVLMTLVRLSKNPVRDQITQTQIDELALITERQDADALRLVSLFRIASSFRPIKLLDLWRESERDLGRGRLDTVSSALRAVARVGIQLWESAPSKPEPHEKPAAPPKKVSADKATSKRVIRRGRVRLLGDGTEVFGLKAVVVPRQGANKEDAQPEDSEEIQFTLEPSNVIRETLGRATPERTRAFVTARQRDAIDWLLVPTQRNALLKVEVRSVVAEMLEDARAAVAEGNRPLLEANLMLLVIAVGSLSTQEARAVRCATLDHALTKTKDVVITPDGYLVRTVPMPLQRYRPGPRTEDLHDVGSRVVLRLPQEIDALLERWLELGEIEVGSGKARLFPSGGAGGQYALSPRGYVIRDRTRVRRFTAQRLCNTLPLLLMDATHDVSIVQMITGDAHGLSPVGCAYFSPTLSQLQARFDEGVETMGFTRAASDPSLSGGRVGSQLCLRDAVVHARVKRLGRGLDYFARYMHDHDSKKIIENHNRMVLYTGWLLQACLATRSHRTVGEMMLCDVALDPGWMIIDDKRTDEAHAARLVGVSSLAVAQLRALASHLDVLSRHAGVPESVRSEMRSALKSKRPLVFFVEAGMAVAWRTDALRHFDPNWKWPSNVLRHRAATQWRLHGCPGDFVASQLGHVELGHVLSMDSPTPPAHFHAIVTQAIDACAKADGWSVKRGYGSGDWSESVVLPLMKDVRRMQAAFEKQERSYLSGTRSDGVPKTKEEATDLRQAIAALLTATVAEAPRVGEIPHLDAVTMRWLRTEVAQKRKNTSASTEWALAELRRLVMQGVREKAWLCDDQRRVFRILVEPSPVATGILGPYRAYCAIRDWYTKALPPAMRAGPNPALWCWLALGLIVDEFITDRVDLQSMLNGLKAARRPRKQHDVLIVPLARTGEPTASGAFVGGRPALLGARFCHLGGNLPEPGELWKTLEAWLHDVLPKSLKPGGGSLLAWVLGVTKLASRLELPGLLRAVRDHTYSAEALPVERMVSLLDERPAPRPMTLPVFDRAERESEAEVTAPVTMDSLMANVVQDLRSILRKMTPQEYHLAHDVRPERNAIREDRKRRLDEAIRSVRRGQEIPRLVLEYAHKLLEKGSSYKPHLADSTVYMYVCEVALAFARLGEHPPQLGLLGRDAEELAELYRDLLEKGRGKRVRDHLRYFQEFLEERYFIPKISSHAVLSGSKTVAQTDVDLITLREYRAAWRLFTDAMKRHRHDAWCLWRLKAARVAMILMFRGSLRMGEVISRLHSDLHVMGKQCILHVHETRLGGLKTPYAKRIVEFGEELLETEVDALRSWLKEAWLPDKRKHRDNVSPLFPNMPGEGMLVSDEDIVDFLGKALQSATNDPLARPHRLRHSAGSYGVLRVMGAPLLAQLRTDGSVATLRRRDIVRLKTWIGHESIRTTLKSYIHTLPLVLPLTGAWTHAYKDGELASIAGIGSDLLRRKRADLVKRGRSPAELPALLMRRYVQPM